MINTPFIEKKKRSTSQKIIITTLGSFIIIPIFLTLVLLLLVLFENQTIDYTYNPYDSTAAVKTACRLKYVEIPSHVRRFFKKYTVNSINRSAFYVDGDFDFSEQIECVVLPHTIVRIKEAAFWECSLDSIHLNEGLKVIEEDAFFQCVDLSSITLPSSLDSIQQYAFRACDGLTSIHFNGTMQEWKKVHTDEYWCDISDTTRVVHCLNGDVIIKFQR